MTVTSSFLFLLLVLPSLDINLSAKLWEISPNLFFCKALSNQFLQCTNKAAGCFNTDVFKCLDVGSALLFGPKGLSCCFFSSLQPLLVSGAGLLWLRGESEIVVET